MFELIKLRAECVRKVCGIILTLMLCVIFFCFRFQPKIDSAELAAVNGPDVTLLRLVIKGKNIFPVCLDQCRFEFGFPFGQVLLA